MELNNTNSLLKLLQAAGLKAGHHVLLHVSFKAVQRKFPEITITQLLNMLCQILYKESGSLIMPAFTYSFKGVPDKEIFNKDISPSKTGAVSEVFWSSFPGHRTSSPTHSFFLTGYAAQQISSENNPTQPLGKDSPLEWFANQPDSYVLHLGTDFTSSSFIHYLESFFALPYIEQFCWSHHNLEPAGISTTGIIPLQHCPGCSKAFNNLLYYFIEHGCLKQSTAELLHYYISARDFMEWSRSALLSQPEMLLCKKGTCAPCDFRRQFIHEK